MKILVVTLFLSLMQSLIAGFGLSSLGLFLQILKVDIDDLNSWKIYGLLLIVWFFCFFFVLVSFSIGTKI